MSQGIFFLEYDEILVAFQEIRWIFKGEKGEQRKPRWKFSNCWIIYFS